MLLEYRTLMFGIVSLLVLFLIFEDISELEEEIANIGGSRKFYWPSSIPQPHRVTAAKINATPLASESKDTISIPPSSCSNTTKLPLDNWTFNKTLSRIIRKNILKFFDPERDISILKGTLKPGDVIHYVFDRQSTTNISENLYHLLPTASPMKNQYHHRCAIVGNSGVLLNSSCGPEIDSHDFVIRCNLAPVEEFARDVGLHTHLVTMNPSVVQRAFKDLADEDGRARFLRRLQSLSGSVLWIPAFMAKGGEKRVEWTIRLILLHTVDVRTAFPSLRLLHAVRGPQTAHLQVPKWPVCGPVTEDTRWDFDAGPRPSQHLSRYWLTNNVQIKRPTTGLLMYTMATRFCEEIHLYGFWPFSHDPQGKPVKYHYYDTLTYEYTSHSSPHTMPLEFRTLNTLHKQGALKLHTGACETGKELQKTQHGVSP